MKTTKIIAIATAITIALIALCGIATATAETSDRGEFYPLLTIVTAWENVDEETALITCMDKEGNLWSFYADRDVWHVGDLANLLMWNVGESLEDQEVIETYFEGHADIHAMRGWFGL